MSQFTQQQRIEKCVLSLDQAIYQTTKRERGLVGAICSIYGLNYNTVSAQINPNNERHALTPDIIEYVLAHAKDKSLVMDAICCAHGTAGWFDIPSGESGEMLDDIVALGQKFVDMNSTTIEAIADKVVTHDEYKAMQKSAIHSLAKFKKY